MSLSEPHANIAAMSGGDMALLFVGGSCPTDCSLSCSSHQLAKEKKKKKKKKKSTTNTPGLMAPSFYSCLFSSRPDKGSQR